MCGKPESDRTDQEDLASAPNLKVEGSLESLGVAFLEYVAFHGHYPPAALYGKDGKPLLSWRVLLLPHMLDGEKIYKQFKLDEPWDSPNNRRLLKEMPAVFAPPKGVKADPFTTFYRVFVGKGTAFEDRRGLSEIPDGDDRTLAVVEAAETVPWTKPDELLYDSDKPLPKLGGHIPGELYGLFFDWEVKRIKQNFDEAKMRQIILCNDGKPTPSNNEVDDTFQGLQLRRGVIE